MAVWQNSRAPASNQGKNPSPAETERSSWWVNAYASTGDLRNGLPRQADSLGSVIAVAVVY
jgi:hypothetical protein